MGRAMETRNKKDVRNKKDKKRKEKEKKRLIRKETGKSSFDDMIAYVDEYGRISATPPDPNKKIQVVDVSCGKCNFNMGGETCRLAVRINGKNYFVEGAAIDDFGDAHAKAGLCKVVRKAQVQGAIVGKIFKATYFKLVEEKKEPGLKVVI